MSYRLYAMTQEEVAKKLGMTRQGVAYAEASALRKLRKKLLEILDAEHEGQRLPDEQTKQTKESA